MVALQGNWDDKVGQFGTDPALLAQFVEVRMFFLHGALVVRRTTRAALVNVPLAPARARHGPSRPRWHTQPTVATPHAPEMRRFCAARSSRPTIAVHLRVAFFRAPWLHAPCRGHGSCSAQQECVAMLLGTASIRMDTLQMQAYYMEHYKTHGQAAPGLPWPRG